MRAISRSLFSIRVLAVWAALAWAGPAVCVAAESERAKLEVSGLGWWGDRDLRHTLELLVGRNREAFDANTIEDAMFLLMSAVQQNGFLKPTIAIELKGEDDRKSEFTLDADMNAVVPREVRAKAVHFKVKRGVHYFVKEVRFEGLEVVPEETARGYFLGEATLFTSRAMRAYTPGRLSRGLESLETELRTRGYAEAKVEAGETRIDDQTGEVKLTIKVTPGVPWRIAEVRAEGADGTVVELKSLERFVGQTWTPNMAQDAATEIRREYLALGHPDVRVRVRAQAGGVVEGRKDVAMTARVEPGEAVTVGQIKFVGATDTRESILRRRVRAQPGDKLNVTELEQARYRISRLGVFDRVDMRIEPDEGPVRDAVFALQPGRRMEVNLLAGYGSYEELRAGVEVRQYNLFGAAHQTRGLLVQSMKSSRGEYSYTVPEIFGESIDGTVKIFGLRRDEAAFERQEWGGSVTASAPISRLGANATASYNFQSVRSGDRQLTALPGGSDPAASPDKVASADFGLTRDRRDSALLPRRGYRVFAQVEAASRKLGGEAEYQRLEFGGSYHTGWGNGRWVHLSASHGVITTWGTTDALLPVNKRFFPGGDGSIRSFQVGEAAPRGADGKFIGAKSYVTLSAELEQALARKWSLVVFGDGLGSATQLKHYPFDETLFALGAGLRYQTLIGPLRAEYGRNMKHRAGDPGGTWLFSVGVPF